MRQVLAAPQASIMKALVEGFMSGQPVAYISVWHRRHDHRRAGDAGPVFHGLRAGNLPAAAADHAHSGGRLPFAPGQQARGQDRRRTVAAAFASAASSSPRD